MPVLIFSLCDSGENPNPQTPSLTYNPDLTTVSHILSASPTPPTRMIGSGMDELLKKEKLLLGHLGRRACFFVGFSVVVVFLMTLKPKRS